MAVASSLARVRRAAEKAAAARQAFEEEIRAANETNTMREIAEAAGLTPGRIHQIVHGK